MKKLCVFLLCILAVSSVSACQFDGREAAPASLPEALPETVPAAGEKDLPEAEQPLQDRDPEGGRNSLMEQADRFAEQAAEALENGEFSFFTQHCVHEYQEPMDYGILWEGLKVKSADIVLMKQIDNEFALENPLWAYELTLMVDETGASPLGEGQSVSIMEISAAGDEGFQILAVVPKEKWQVQYPWYLDKRGTEPQLQVQFLRSFFGVQGFASPEELGPETLLHASLYYACADGVPRDELERTQVTKEQVDEAGKRHFGILGVTDLSESLAETLYDSEEGKFIPVPLEGAALNQRLVGETRQQDGTVSCTFELYLDPLQMILSSSVTYTLSPNGEVWQFLCAVENPVGEE